MKNKPNFKCILCKHSNNVGCTIDQCSFMLEDLNQIQEQMEFYLFPLHENSLSSKLFLITMSIITYCKSLENRIQAYENEIMNQSAQKNQSQTDFIEELFGDTVFDIESIEVIDVYEKKICPERGKHNYCIQCIHSKIHKHTASCEKCIPSITAARNFKP